MNKHINNVGAVVTDMKLQSTYVHRFYLTKIFKGLCNLRLSNRLCQVPHPYSHTANCVCLCVEKVHEDSFPDLPCQFGIRPEQNTINTSLIPRPLPHVWSTLEAMPFPPPVFDRLQHAKTKESPGRKSHTCVTSGRQRSRGGAQL